MDLTLYSFEEGRYWSKWIFPKSNCVMNLYCLMIFSDPGNFDLREFVEIQESPDRFFVWGTKKETIYCFRTFEESTSHVFWRTHKVWIEILYFCQHSLHQNRVHFSSWLYWIISFKTILFSEMRCWFWKNMLICNNSQ